MASDISSAPRELSDNAIVIPPVTASLKAVTHAKPAEFSTFCGTCGRHLPIDRRPVQKSSLQPQDLTIAQPRFPMVGHFVPA
jgi:hypothetical protein